MKVLTTELGKVNVPKSVPSVFIGPESPSAIVLPSPCRLISGMNPVLPTPAISKLNGFSSGSFVTNETFAFRIPKAVGVNVILKVVLAAGAKLAAGGVVTTNSEALTPLIFIEPIVNVTVPEFCIV